MRIGVSAASTICRVIKRFIDQKSLILSQVLI